jgi:hypothetical protein
MCFLKLLLKLISMGLIGVVLAGGIAWAVNSGIYRGDKLHLSSPPTLTQGIAPEIDAASGTSAIALLTGVVLLAGEKSRSQRS